MLENEINDIRIEKDFRSITFSEFKKTEVKKELLSCLKNSQLESSFYWSCEFICAGQFNDLWENIIYFYSKHIHLANPKLSIYLHLQINNFKEIYRNGYVSYELAMRNNPKIRKIFAEVIYILVESKKKHTFEEIKVKKEDFDLSVISEKMKAPNIHYGEIVFRSGDPKEIYIAINELIYFITEEKNSLLACYWLEWLIEFDSKPIKYKMERRLYVKENKFQLNLIWIVWEIFIELSKEKQPLIKKIINSLLELFMLKYTVSCNRKRKFLMYMAIELLTSTIVFDEEIIKDKEKMGKIIEKISIIYKEVKKNEKNPSTDYLFHNVNNNLNQTISKLEKMNEIGETFIPRL